MIELTKWYEEEIDPETEGDDILEYDITTSPRDLTPSNIVDMIDSEIIEIPIFQRNYVWEISKASKLIESLILGLPIPELFFYSEGDENTTYKVIDGQQRLLSIYFFVKGRYPKESMKYMLKSEINQNSANLDRLIANNDFFKDFELWIKQIMFPVLVQLLSIIYMEDMHF